MEFTLSSTAITMIEELADRFRDRLRDEDVVPVVTWMVGDTGIQTFTQQIGADLEIETKLTRAGC